MTERREITLTVGETDFTFALDSADVTKYFNSVNQNSKVAPSVNLLSNTVHQEQRATLKQLLKNPVTAMQLAGTLLEEYAPDVEITVKKPSPTLND
ncbi:putative phage tail assembly chaperone [Pseudomonas sp. B392_1p]|uniref:putative phage tail assembly chaperone n=1 Tax=Pseudomonas sp. B392_1p TaxID=3457507 RepID=UPI003FD15D66